MTDRFANLDCALCDKLLSFIYPDESNMTDEEIQAELQRLKIDMRPAIEKLNMALNFCNQKQKAQAELNIAREKRPALINKLKQIKMPSFIDLRDEIQKRIAQHLSAPQQATYFRKLEEGASEQDLKTLLEDILLLESLDQDSKDEK
jgi:DNA polymerase III delta prime subunit